VLNKSKQTKEIFETAFQKDSPLISDIEARDIMVDFINKNLRHANDRLMYNLNVKDPDKLHWRKKEHFAKIFHFEFKHAEEYYSLTKPEKYFLYELSEHLMWQTNLIVDEEDKPLNQKELAVALDVNVRTVQRNMKSLEEKTIIYKVEMGNEVFYFVNPYFMFIGQYINVCIPKLFDEIGYQNSSLVKKSNSRNNRSKKQEKRLSI
jgi:predicted transcriptional regulator